MGKSTYAVFATSDGRTAYSRINGLASTGYGQIVIIDNRNGHYTLFAHLAINASAGLVAVGAVVARWIRKRRRETVVCHEAAAKSEFRPAPRSETVGGLLPSLRRQRHVDGGRSEMIVASPRFEPAARAEYEASARRWAFLPIALAAFAEVPTHAAIPIASRHVRLGLIRLLGHPSESSKVG